MNYETRITQEPVNCSDSELCTFLQALAEGFLPTFYSDTSQSAQSKSMSIASKSYQRGKKTVSFHGFQSLTMCKHSTDDHGEDSSMLLPVDFRAKTSALPGKEQASTGSAAGYGASLPASLAKYDPDTHSLKTAQLSLIEDSTGCYVTLPRSGWMRGGECYQLPMLVRRTNGNASGLWRTPTVGMLNADRAKDPEYTARKELKGQTITLADQVKHERLWPTPTVCWNHNRKGASATSGDGLATAVKMWPTPKAHEPGMSAKTTGRDVTKSTHLTTQVALAEGMIDKQTGRMWRTPSASVVDAKSSVVKLTGRTPKDPQVGLADQIMAAERHMWPTPTVCGNNNRKGVSATSGDGLATAVRKYPTQSATDGQRGGVMTANMTGKSLTQVVNSMERQTFATPTARDWKSGKSSQKTIDRNSRPLSEQIGGQLNPTWVEWLMGWPTGWTDLKPLETGKSHCAQQQRGACSQVEDDAV